MSRGAKAAAVAVSGNGVSLYTDEYSQPDDIAYSV
jgi:hypothetical protein